MMPHVPSTPAPDRPFHLTLPEFEGPLDLLLHLIQKHELDIVDLPIAFVTERYLEYLNLMERLNLDVASEYLLMAAMLAHIKSKTLLPPDPNEQEEELFEEEADPRAELIRKLLEYQKYKGAAEDLAQRPVRGRDVFYRGVPAPKAEGPAPLASTNVFKLLDAFQAVLARTKANQAFGVTAERISIQDRIAEITDKLKSESSCPFEELFETTNDTYDVVVTFLAILEMAKMHMLRLYQPTPEAPLYLESRITSFEGDELAEDQTAPPVRQSDVRSVLRAPERPTGDAAPFDDSPRRSDSGEPQEPEEPQQSEEAENSRHDFGPAAGENDYDQ